MGRWITVKGRRVFIEDGETPSEAIARSKKKKQYDNIEKISEQNGGITYVTRKDGAKCMIAKYKNQYEVSVDGKDTGYKFRSKKQAIDYCDKGF